MAMPRIADHSYGSVVDFIAEGTTPAAETTAIGGEDLHRGYAQWCAERGGKPLEAGAFMLEFDRLRGLPELQGKIRKFGSRYFGIALTQETQKRLTRG